MEKISSSFINFDILAADVNTLDTSAVTLWTFPDNELIRIPTRLEIQKAAGTAYAITYNLPMNTLDVWKPALRTIQSDADKSLGYSNESKEYVGRSMDVTTMSGPEAYLIVRDDYNRPIFYVPADLFLQTALANKMVVFPNLCNAYFRPGRNTFKMFANVGIASGTGTVSGRMHFDEYGFSI